MNENQLKFEETLKKAKTGQEFRDAAMLIPDRKYSSTKLSQTLEHLNLDIAEEKLKGDAILKNPGLCSSDLCQVHVKLITHLS